MCTLLVNETEAITETMYSSFHQLYMYFFSLLVNKMGHILKLADDYKVEGVHDFCSKMLRDLPKSEDNAVKVFFLSTQTLMAREDDRLEPVRSQCKTIVKDMDLVDIQGSGVLKKLNKDACESLLVERIKGLETQVTQVYPQFVGLAEYCLHLGLKCSLPGLVKCPEHFINAKVNTALPERIVSCLYCKKMINQLVQLSSLESEGLEHVYGGEHHFNSDLISILKNFTTVMRSLQRKTSLGAAQNLLIAGTSPFEAKTHAASPVCDSKAFTETVKSVGFPPPEAKPGIQALPSPIVGNEAYQSKPISLQFANVAPGSPTTDVETTLSGSTIKGLTTLRTVTCLGGTPFEYKGSTGIGTGTFVSTTTSSVTFGTGSSLFGSAGSTETVGKGNFGQLTLATTPASKANSASFPLNRRGKR